MSEFLFIGAHADDLEIGAGGTIAKLASNPQHTVNMCVITKESTPEKAKIREQESREAAKHLGIDPKEHLFFLGFDEKSFVYKKDTSKFENFIRKNNLNPDIVITHVTYGGDTHQHHKYSRELVEATFRPEGIFRHKAILGYEVVNSRTSAFSPQVFVDISDYMEVKIKALEAHKSQADKGRILREKILESCASYGQIISAKYAEAFDCMLRNRNNECQSLVADFNDSPLHRFWYPLISNRKLMIIREVPDSGPPRIKPEPRLSGSGSDYLQMAFSESHWPNTQHPYPIDLVSSKLEVEERLSLDILLSGASNTNWITMYYFNHFIGLRYIIDYDMPNFNVVDLYIWDRKENKKVFPDIRRTGSGSYITRDVGVLTIMKNPMTNQSDKDRCLIGCMGTHVHGTLACYITISDNILLKELINTLTFSLDEDTDGYQIIVSIDTEPQSAPPQERIKILHDTKHIIRKKIQ